MIKTLESRSREFYEVLILISLILSPLVNELYIDESNQVYVYIGLFLSLGWLMISTIKQRHIIEIGIVISLMIAPYFATSLVMSLIDFEVHFLVQLMFFYILYKMLFEFVRRVIV